MLTPQEVAERSFPKSKFSGYDMAEVDEFLDSVTEDYSTLFKENTVLKSKMKVLVDKIAEYRSTEDAMRTTLLTAQKMASSMIAEAEEKKAKIIKEAEAPMQERLDALRREIANEEARLAAAQTATAEFTAQIRESCRQHLALLDDLPNIEAEQPVVANEDVVEAAAEEIDASLHRIVEEEDNGRKAESSPPEESGRRKTDAAKESESDLSETERQTARELDELEAQATRRIDFDNLQFGRDYEVK